MNNLKLACPNCKGRLEIEDWEDEYPECQKLEVRNE